MRIPLLLALLCAPFAQGAKTRVAVLGAIHGSHLGSKGYSVEAVIETVRNYKPDVVCVEIPPDLFAGHVKAIDRKGFGTTKSDLQGQRWIGAFPELYRGVIPLRKELGFEVVPVSGWRPEVSADRKEFWQGAGKQGVMADRRRIYDEVRAALTEIQDRERHREDPRFVNSQHYSDVRQLERTLWAACFDEGLGRGGEVAINRAHWRNIAAALERHRGKRILIVYGAAHRYWFLRELRRRDDVQLLDVRDYLPAR